MNNRALMWIIAIIIILGGAILLFTYKPAQAPEQMEQTEQPAMMEDGEGENAMMEAMEPNPDLEGEITIGAVLPLTGDAAAYGLPIQKAIQLASEEINAKDGIGGKKVVIQFEDGACDGKEALTASQKLINSDEIQALIGGVCSSEVLGMAPALNDNKRVLLSPSATSPDITTDGGDYVFRLVPSDALASTVAGRFAAEDLKAHTAAVLSENTDYPQGLRKGFIDEFKAQGGTIAVDETWNTGTTDFRTQALKIKNAGVDVVYLVPQTPAPGLAALQALRDQGVEAKILTAEVLTGREVAAENAELLEGVYGFEANYNEQSSQAIAFQKAMKDRFGSDLDFPLYQANGYSALYLYKDLIEDVGNDGGMLQEKLAHLGDWSGGALSGITLNSDGDIEWKSYQVKLITDGQVTNEKVFDF